jgi:hypothetical protein
VGTLRQRCRTVQYLKEVLDAGLNAGLIVANNTNNVKVLKFGIYSIVEEP